MRNLKNFRIDQSGSARGDTQEIALDAATLDRAAATGNDARAETAAEGGDVIAGLRNGFLLSAAFWVLAYFGVQFFLR